MAMTREQALERAHRELGERYGPRCLIWAERDALDREGSRPFASANRYMKRKCRCRNCKDAYNAARRHQRAERQRREALEARIEAGCRHRDAAVTTIRELSLP